MNNEVVTTEAETLPGPIEEVGAEIARVDTKLASESVVIAAPMSFHGSAARIWKLTSTDVAERNPWAKAGLGTFAVLAIALAWTLVACWYVLFGLLLVPYRLIRRGQRKRKLDSARHRELLDDRAPRRLDTVPADDRPEGNARSDRRRRTAGGRVRRG